MRIFFTIIGLILAIGILAQDAEESYLENDELLLYDQYERMFDLQGDDQRRLLNDSILYNFESALISYESFDYTFDSLRRIGMKYSPDRKFRIINWNIPWQDGTHTYYGFIQLPRKKEKRCEVIHIIDQSHEIEDPENLELFSGTWYGVLYYDILLNKYSGQKYYTLLGFDFNDRFSNKKVIDVLTFENGMPFFGKPIFEPEKGGDRQHRLIYEFAPDVVMAMRYDPRFKMIVLDHLSPIEPVFEGNYKFYAPDFSYDGYRWKKGVWQYQSNVDVRNR